MARLCYRPLGEIEKLSNRKVALITSAMAAIEPDKLPEAMEPNTARKSLITIAEYLKFYREVFLDPHIRSNSLRIVLKEAYEKTQNDLKKEISGTKQNHHLTIRSLPSRRFLELIRKVVLEPETLFLTARDKPSSTLYRDRAMVLLACEGLRPGAIGNISRPDFRGNYLVIQDHRNCREGRTTTGAPVLKLGDTTRINSASETMLTLYPFTTDAINDYIRFERDPILAKHLKNRSLGFLFLHEKGEPIKHRSSITGMFKRLGERLAQQGLLDIGNDPYFPDQSQYDFYGYVLRHSAASFFLEMKGTDDGVLDAMKVRFGWTIDSIQPQRYANRALSDQAGVDLMQFYEQLLVDAAASRRKE